MSFKWWALISVVLFAFGMVLGLTQPGEFGRLLAEQLAGLEQLAKSLAPFQLSTALFIYIRNASSLLLSFIFSPFFCLVPVIALVANGGLITFVAATVIGQRSLWILLAGILPHGIIELPAIIIGEAAALSLGISVMLAIVSRERRKLLLPGFKQSLKYLLIALALLVPAAVIETFVTPLLIALLQRT